VKGLEFDRSVKNVPNHENFGAANFGALYTGWCPPLPRLGSSYFCGKDLAVVISTTTNISACSIYITILK
jgi:hypothetical protein